MNGNTCPHCKLPLKHSDKRVVICQWCDRLDLWPIHDKAY